MGLPDECYYSDVPDLRTGEYFKSAPGPSNALPATSALPPDIIYEQKISFINALLTPISHLATTQKKIDSFYEELKDVEEVESLRLRVLHSHVDILAVTRAVDHVKDTIGKRPDAAVLEELIVLNKRLQPYARRLGKQLDALYYFLVAYSVYKFNAVGPYAHIACVALDSMREKMYNIIASS